MPVNMSLLLLRKKAGYPRPAAQTSTPADKLAPDRYSDGVHIQVNEEEIMQVYQCCEAIRIAYNQIGSGEQGYVPQAIAATIRALNAVASDERVPAELRQEAAYAAANLLISDHQDA
jgi:hypothetical protein